MSVLELRNVSYAYGGSHREVLREAGVRLEGGSMYAVLGPSGSGKTTLLSLLAGLDVPTRGSILFEGNDILARGLEHHRRHHVSLVFQSCNLIDYMTPLENVRIAARLDAAAILRRLGLAEDEMHRNVLRLSGGQQQRVAIARALASDTPVILADEPTGSLDADTAREITATLRRSAETLGKCVVVATHSVEVARQSDVVLEIRHGRLKERMSL